MDQFCFNKKFTYDIVANLRNKRLHSPTQSHLKEHEADIFSENDENLSRYAQKGKEQSNSSLSNPIEPGTREI
jgi:hypothetical protein